jgi:hypothetical protein
VTIRSFICGAFLAVLAAAFSPLAAQTGEPGSPATPSLERRIESPPSISQIIDRIIAREHYQNWALTYMHPVMQTHIQDLRLRHGEAVPWREWNLQGQARIAANLSVHDDTHPNIAYNPAGFLQEAFVDRGGFDGEHYRFVYAGEATVDGNLCWVFEINPLGRSPADRGGRFQGRIWANETDYTIIRFTGTFLPAHNWELVPTPHRDTPNFAEFDSYRYSAVPGIWLPERIDSHRDTPVRDGTQKWIFTASTAFSGYDLATLRDPKFPVYDQARFQRLVLPKPTLGREFWTPWVVDFGMVATLNAIEAHCSAVHTCAPPNLFGAHPSALEVIALRDGLLALDFKLARDDKLHGHPMWWHYETYLPLMINGAVFLDALLKASTNSRAGLFPSDRPRSGPMARAGLTIKFRLP